MQHAHQTAPMRHYGTFTGQWTFNHSIALRRKHVFVPHRPFSAHYRLHNAHDIFSQTYNNWTKKIQNHYVVSNNVVCSLFSTYGAKRNESGALYAQSSVYQFSYRPWMSTKIRLSLMYIIFIVSRQYSYSIGEDEKKNWDWRRIRKSGETPKLRIEIEAPWSEEKRNLQHTSAIKYVHIVVKWLDTYWRL